MIRKAGCHFSLGLFTIKKKASVFGDKNVLLEFNASGNGDTKECKQKKKKEMKSKCFLLFNLSQVELYNDGWFHLFSMLQPSRRQVDLHGYLHI